MCTLIIPLREEGEEVKRSGRDNDPSPPSVAEIMSERSYTSTPPIRFHDLDRNSLTVLFLSCSNRCKVLFRGSSEFYDVRVSDCY